MERAEAKRELEKRKELRKICQHFLGALLNGYWKAKKEGDSITSERYLNIYAKLEFMKGNLIAREGKRGYREEYEQALELIAERFDKDNVTPETVSDTIIGIEELCDKYQIGNRKKENRELDR